MQQDSRLAESSATHAPAMSRPRWLLAGLWSCIVIAVAAVIRRLVALGHPSLSGPPQVATLDAFFAGHAALTLAHIVPALFFVLLIPMFYSRRFAGRVWIERLLYGLGAVVGLTAYAMSTHAVGGWVERSAVLCLQQPVSIQPGPVLPLSAARSASPQTHVDDPRYRDSARYRHHPPGHGDILCHQSSHASGAEAVLRDCDSGLVSRSTPSPSSYGSALEERPASNRKAGGAFGAVTGCLSFAYPDRRRICLPG